MERKSAPGPSTRILSLSPSKAALFLLISLQAQL
jgi:hypothetical protein